jgi:hypothetical protein
MVTAKKKLFLTHTGLLAYYLNFNIVIYFKFKLQLMYSFTVSAGHHFEGQYVER